MGHEIIYTSARRGLRPGSTGYCVVAATGGIAPNLLNHLEKLTGYEHLFDPKSRNARANPVAFMHFNVPIGGKRQHILGRVSNAPLDYSSRSNLIAHLVALDEHELQNIGNPAQALQQITWETEWADDHEPRSLPNKQLELKPTPVEVPQPCKAWADLTGDAGWGGVLAEALAGGRYRQAAVILPREWLLEDLDPGQKYLSLIDESLRLLPREERWNVGFSTYYTANLPLGIRCDWQFVIAGTPLAERLRRDPRTLSIELSHEMPPAPDGELVQVAREGGVHRMKSAARAPVRPKVDAPILPDDPSPRRAVTASSSDAEVPGYGLSISDDASPQPPRRRGKKQVRKSREKQLLALIVALSLAVCVLIGLIVWQSWSQSEVANSAPDQSPTAESSSLITHVDDASTPAPPPSATSPRASTPVVAPNAPPPTRSPGASDKTAESGNRAPAPRAPSPTKPGAASVQVNPLSPAAGDSSVAAATSTGTEPPQPAPPQEHPFDDIRRQRHILDLPQLDQGAILKKPSSSQPAAPGSLARIAIDSSARMELEIIGDSAFIGDVVIVTVTKDGREWELRRRGDNFGVNKPMTFGTFRLVDDDLQFEWKEAKREKGDFGLRNCLLRLTVNNPHDKVVCALRSPVRIKPIKLTTAQLNQDLALELTDVEAIKPDEQIMIELRWEGLESLPAGARFQPVPVGVLTDSSANQACLKLLENETDEEPAAVVAAEFSSKGGQRLLKLTKYARRDILNIDDSKRTVEWNIEDSRNGQFQFDANFRVALEKDIKANADDLKRSKGIAQNQLSKFAGELETTREGLKSAKGEPRTKLLTEESKLQQSVSDLEQWVSDLDEAMKTNEARDTWAKGIEQAFTALNNNVRLHVRMYRVFPEFPDNDVAVLLETEGFYEVPQVTSGNAPATAGPQPRPGAK